MFHFVYADKQGNAYDHPNYTLADWEIPLLSRQRKSLSLPGGPYDSNRTAVVMDKQDNLKNTREGWAVGATTSRLYPDAPTCLC